ncbi:MULTISPECIES: hypothetical protein [Bacteroidales]|uniref:hypothetical protein n=1 Tax=Bacteroidales TaxID=171549 RepID=UPI00244E54AD|nr:MULTISPECIES: hypothetical protein [Bacteroidales]
MHRHLRSTGLSELASDTLSETLPIKFDPQRMVPVVYSSNPDSARQTASQSHDTGFRLSHASAGSPQSQDEGFVHGSALPDDFKLWLSRHPGLTIDEAISRYREEQKAKRRRQGPKLH